VELLVRALVDRPEAVSVTAVEGEHSLVLEVRVDPDDIGKVIGKQGRIIHAVRVVTKAAAVRVRKRVTVEVVS